MKDFKYVRLFLQLMTLPGLIIGQIIRKNGYVRIWHQFTARVQLSKKNNHAETNLLSKLIMKTFTYNNY